MLEHNTIINQVLSVVDTDERWNNSDTVLYNNNKYNNCHHQKNQIRTSQGLLWDLIKYLVGHIKWVKYLFYLLFHHDLLFILVHVCIDFSSVSLWKYEWPLFSVRSWWYIQKWQFVNSYLHFIFVYRDKTMTWSQQTKRQTKTTVTWQPTSPWSG